jgi:hypothetical protein
MIHLRRVTEAQIQNGSITKEKLAVGAVELDSDKVTGELPNSKLAKIEDVEKLKDGLVTLAKTTDDVKLTPFVAGEVEQSVTGIVEEAIVETGLSKLAGKFEPKKVRVIASLKVSSGTGSLKIYADDEEDARLTLQTASLTYELVNGEFDVSDLEQGRHNLIGKLVGSAGGVIVSNDYFELYVIK